MKSAAGYVLGGHDISAYLFENASEKNVCSRCKTCLDRNYIPANIKISPSQVYGFGHTRDLQHLFSWDLIKLITQITGQKFDYFLVSDRPKYFYVIAHESIAFDAERRKTRFGAPCLKCGRPNYIVGATPAYLKCKSIPDSGFFRTDLEFGDKNGRSPLFILGKSLKQEIELQNLRGVFFKDAYCLDGEDQ